MLFMKIFVVFYIKAPHSIVGVSALYHENGGNMFIQNVVMDLLNYTVSNPEVHDMDLHSSENVKSLIDCFLFSV